MDNPANVHQVMEFTTALPVVVLCRPVQPPGADWSEFDHGPGPIQLPQGVEASLRVRNLDDELLAQLVSEIAACTAITSLNLAENRNVTNEGIAALSQLSWLVELNLSSCSITNTGLASLKGLPRLSRLDLSYCNRITDLGLKTLRSLKNLAYLNLQGCVKVTNSGVARLRRPGLSIIKFKKDSP